MNIPFISVVVGFCLTVSSAQGLSAETSDLSTVARQILDATKPAPERDALIAAQSNKSAALIHELVQQVTVGTPDEYRGIPSIWQVAIAAGKRNDAAELKQILSISLPTKSEPLRDWQAVVIGGGIINGLSLEGIWPRERIETILKPDADLMTRWLHSLKLASAMADDEKVRPGTRYDALRMLGVASWEDYGAQLTKYLGKNVHGELQQGAVCGLSDIKSTKVAPVLLENFNHLTERNQQFALDALLRNDARTTDLLNAIADNKIKFSVLGAERIKTLKASSNEKLRQRVNELEETPDRK